MARYHLTSVPAEITRRARNATWLEVTLPNETTLDLYLMDSKAPEIARLPIGSIVKVVLELETASSVSMLDGSDDGW